MAEPDLRAFVARNDTTTLLRLEGPLRYSCAGPLRRVVDRLTDADELGDVFILDLRATTFIDSTCLGLITRAGRLALTHCGRRAVIIAPKHDIMTVLLSAALDVLFVMVDEPPGDAPADLVAVQLAPWTGAGAPGALGRVVLDAHRDLAALSEKNRDEYRDVIAALEADLAAAKTTSRSL